MIHMGFMFQKVQAIFLLLGSIHCFGCLVILIKTKPNSSTRGQHESYPTDHAVSSARMILPLSAMANKLNAGNET